MSEFYEFKETIDPLRKELKDRFSRIRYLIEHMNDIISERGVSYIPNYMDDMFRAVRELFNMLPEVAKGRLRGRLAGIRELVRKAMSVSYEDIATGEYPIHALLRKFVDEVQDFEDEVCTVLDKLGLLYRREKVFVGGEE